MLEKSQIAVFVRVLISTYWNVNDMEWLKEHEKEFVLISTYWNVNVIASVSFFTIFWF